MKRVTYSVLKWPVPADSPVFVKRCLRRPAPFVQPEGNADRIVHLRHNFAVHMAHFFFEPLLVNGSDLFEQNDRILGKPEFLGAAR